MSDLVRQAKEILAGRQKACPPDSLWHSEWKCLSSLVKSVRPTDPRFEVILAWLEEADTAYLRGNFSSFSRAKKRIELIVQKVRTGKTNHQ